VANYIQLTNVTGLNNTSVLISVSDIRLLYRNSTSEVNIFYGSPANQNLRIAFSQADTTYSLHAWFIGQISYAIDYSLSEIYVVPSPPDVSSTQVFFSNITLV